MWFHYNFQDRRHKNFQHQANKYHNRRKCCPDILHSIHPRNQLSRWNNPKLLSQSSLIKHQSHLPQSYKLLLLNKHNTHLCNSNIFHCVPDYIYHCSWVVLHMLRKDCRLLLLLGHMFHLQLHLLFHYNSPNTILHLTLYMCILADRTWGTHDHEPP